MPTLSVMRAEVILEGDLTGIVENSDVDTVINHELAALHELLSDTFEDYSLTSSDLTITAGNSSVALPATFYKARGVDDIADSANPRELPRFSFGDRNRRAMPKSYAIVGSNLQVRPTDNAAGAYRLWFVPLYTALSADGDTFTCPERWYLLAVLNAAARFKTIQDRDASDLTARAERIRERIQASAASRDAGYPRKVRDVRRTRYERSTETWDPEMP